MHKTMKILGLLFHESAVKGTNFKRILSFYDSARGDRLTWTFEVQQVGASPHWGLELSHYFDFKCTQRRTRKGDPVEWPPRSLDFNLSDFICRAT